MREPGHAVQRLVGERIRELRTARGLTQLALAGRAGISRPSIANLEAGRQNVGLRQLCALAAALGVSADVLLTGPDASCSSRRPDAEDGDCPPAPNSGETWREVVS